MCGQIRAGVGAIPAALLCFLISSMAQAQEKGNRGDIIGANQYYQVREGESLLEIARLHDFGFIELVTANPGMDPWVPEPGRTVLLPGEHILPDAPRRGIVINLPELRLYYYGAGFATPITYPIGVGRLGRETPLGSTSITTKRQSPTWTPPASVRAERPDLPAIVPPGPDNPLGLFAMNLAWRNYVIHGTNKPYGIGRRVSSGCIRLYPEDIERLFDTVDVGTPVMVVDQEIKLGWSAGELYLEIHPSVAEGDNLEEKGWYAPHPVPGLKERILEAAGEYAAKIDWATVARAQRANRSGCGLLIRSSVCFAAFACPRYCGLTAGRRFLPLLCWFTGRFFGLGRFFVHLPIVLGQRQDQRRHAVFVRRVVSLPITRCPPPHIDDGVRLVG